jgi:hypothetical protein
MFEKRVGRFSTVTQYRELFHKEISEIDLYLVEACLMNHGPNLFATGTIKRRIRYIELDGGFRRIEDRIQFSVSLGESFSGSLADLQTELCQDYFIFQPMPKDSHTAVLEQGFCLNINPSKQVEKTQQYHNLRVNSVIKQGRGSTLIQIPFKPAAPRSEPQSFTGKVNFKDLSNLPIVIAEIEGNIHEKTPENRIHTTYLKETVSLLVDVPAPSQDHKLILSSEILEIDWRPTTEEPNTTLTLRFNYQWHLTAFRELLCLEPDIENDLSTVKQIETLVLKSQNTFHFMKPFQIEVPHLKELIEIKLEELHYQNFLTQKGIVLHADLTLGFTFTNLNGVEQYQEYQTFMDELFPRVISNGENLKPVIDADLNIQILESAFHNRQLSGILNFEYSPRIYQNQITTIVKDDSSPEIIIAKIYSGEKTFSFNTIVNFDTRFDPLRVIRATGKVLKLTGLAQEGWASINGVIEVNITYIDQQRKLHEDLFQSIVKNLCMWDQLNPEMELELDGVLEYEHFQLLDMNIEYQCLVKINMKAFQQKRMGVKIALELPKTVPSTEFKQKQKTEFQAYIKDLVMDWDMPLRKGRIQEIAKGQVEISRFHYQYSQNAILIDGCLSGELEYWDQKQYLQKISLNLPFWRFIPNDDDLQLKDGQLIPKVRNCSYSPLQTLPWRKRHLKIHLELGLCTHLGG